MSRASREVEKICDNLVAWMSDERMDSMHNALRDLLSDLTENKKMTHRRTRIYKRAKELFSQFERIKTWKTSNKDRWVCQVAVALDGYKGRTSYSDNRYRMVRNLVEAFKEGLDLPKKSVTAAKRLYEQELKELKTPSFADGDLVSTWVRKSNLDWRSAPPTTSREYGLVLSGPKISNMGVTYDLLVEGQHVTVNFSQIKKI